MLNRMLGFLLSVSLVSVDPIVATEPRLLMAHGTAILVIYGSQGIVIAADGTALVFDPNGKTHKEDRKQPKIVICNGSFLCGTAGTDPIHVPAQNFYYDFDKWIASIDAQRRPARSVSDYADTLMQSAQTTFVNNQSRITVGNFWRNAASSPVGFVAYVIVGYSTGVPEYCKVDLGLNFAKRTMRKPTKICKRLTWPDPQMFGHLMPSGDGDLIERAISNGTTEAARRAQLIPRFQSDTVRIFPNLPVRTRRYVALAATLMEIEDEYHLEDGGTTAIGIVTQNTSPVVKKFLLP